MNDIVGIIPAGGLAKRITPIPCSKELLPIGFSSILKDGEEKEIPKPVSLYLIERMMTAGADKFFIILNKDKWDIPRYYGAGIKDKASFSYLIQENLQGMPFALNQVQPWLNNETVLFGMPDTVFTPEDAYTQLLDVYTSASADLVLGLFPTDKPERFGMVDFLNDGRMLSTIDKPLKSTLKFMWGIACWGKIFTEYMKEYLAGINSSQGNRSGIDISSRVGG